MPTFSATNNAYIADCTPDGTRAQIYSRIVGVLMLGLAIGPVLGSFIIARTGDVLSVFYFSTVLHSAMFLVVLLFLPESLSKAARSLLVKQAEERRLALKERDLAERQWEGTGDDDDDGADANASGWSRLTTDQAMRRSKGTARRMTRRALGFLAPLEIFLPGYAAEEDDDDATGLPTKGRKRNWNLTLLAIGYSGTLCLMVRSSPLFPSCPQRPRADSRGRVAFPHTRASLSSSSSSSSSGSAGVRPSSGRS